MNIITYIKGLAHRFSKNQVQKSCELVSESLRAHTIPAYVAAADLFKSSKIKSKEGTEFITTFKKLATYPRSGTIMDAILEALENSVKLLDFVSKKADTLYADSESNLGLTFQKATYLRLVSAVTFTNDFSRKFLNYVYVLETGNADDDFKIKDSITPAEIKFVENNFSNFCVCVSILQQSIESIETNVDNLPDAIVSETSENTFESTMGRSKIDPLGLRGFSIPIDISAKCNPFYFFGAIIADYQVAAYKAAKEEHELLQLRKLNLEKIYEKKPDARLQKEMEYLSNRISGLNYELSKTEAQYA